MIDNAARPFRRVDRDEFAAVGGAMRDVIGRALAADLSRLELRVLLAALSVTASWSKRMDFTTRSAVASIVYGIDPEDVAGWQRKRVEESLRAIVAAGVLEVSTIGAGRGARIRLSLSTQETTLESGGCCDDETTPDPEGGSTIGERETTPGFARKRPLVSRGNDPYTGGHTEKVEKSFEKKELRADGFDDFWSQYPRRNGQRMGKANATKQWARLSPIDRTAATASLPLYTSTTNGFPKDAERYLRDRLWADLDHDAKPPSAKNDRALADFLDVVLPDTPDTEALIA